MERIAGPVLDFASWHVLPFGMRLNKSVNNDGSGSVLADWLIDCGSALFVCKFDLNLFHLVSIRLRDLYGISIAVTICSVDRSLSVRLISYTHR